MQDNYTAIPVFFSPEDNEWLIPSIELGYSRPVKDFIRCDCHDLIWHYAELHVIPVSEEWYGESELLVCDLPFNTWPDHSPNAEANANA